MIEFSFTATLDRHGWDHGALLRSIPVPEGSDCAALDPYADSLFASGVIEVAQEPDETSEVADATPSRPGPFL